jgi:putative DNA methylase
MSRLIESDGFPIEFLSRLAERESWRKEIHRPVYHLHKWWAKRLGSVFRGILLGCVLPDSSDLSEEFYRSHAFTGMSVFDPFMGSGTTLGEAHKLAFTALGRDINPVAARAVAAALGPMERRDLLAAYEELERDVGKRIRSLYRSRDSKGAASDVLYFFWVMQAQCPKCLRSLDLFSSYVFARNARPDRQPRTQVVCPRCGAIFTGFDGQAEANCPDCAHQFRPTDGPASGGRVASCTCGTRFSIVDAMASASGRPAYRLYAKLVLNCDGNKEYLRASEEDVALYETCARQLTNELQNGEISVPTLQLEDGYNTRQAIRYGFQRWRDFFNDRQLLALAWLQDAIRRLSKPAARRAMLTLFSGVLEFNNLFATYKGEGTGAVRHMFSHHILKPERMPIEANVWGTPKSSGSFYNLFRTRMLRVVDYRLNPTEIKGRNAPSVVCSGPFSGVVNAPWPTDGAFATRGLYISCGDSAITDLPALCIDLIVTDPPFFDNVHYSELADFFFAWQQPQGVASTTRDPREVQDSDSQKFSEKLRDVFRECHRVLRDDGLLVFTYHHSRTEGWQSLAAAVLDAGFVVINSHPVRAEMSVGTPKSAAKQPIQLDTILVCGKQANRSCAAAPKTRDAIDAAHDKVVRLSKEGFDLSMNDKKVVYYGQLLSTLRDAENLQDFTRLISAEIENLPQQSPRAESPAQKSLF